VPVSLVLICVLVYLAFNSALDTLVVLTNVVALSITAIFGLLPAAVSRRIGSETRRPLAIVVVAGMLATLQLNRYLMPVLYSLHGHREPPAGAGSMAH
jgi:cobalt-zinc-cadmium resistance protein CzcA